MRPLYVENDQLNPDRIGYVRFELEAALSIGAYRLPTSTNDLSQLKENAAIYQKIASAADHACRDVQARITFLENQEEQRRLAAAHSQAAPQPQAAAPRQCACGDHSVPYTVHRTDGPCYRVDNPPCQNCQGHGCPNCSGHGLALVHPAQTAGRQPVENHSGEAPTEQTRHLQPVDDTRAPMASEASFGPPTRTPAPTPGH